VERQITPLKIRGVRPARLLAVRLRQASQGLAGGGVMEITPFIPLTLRGRFKERPLACWRRMLKELQGSGVVYEAR